MGYQVALDKAWEEFKTLEKDKVYLKFLNDEYEIDLSKKLILSASCNIDAKPYYKILILHYILNENKASDIRCDEWISFKELEGGEIYFSAFRKRAIEPILRKYGDNPQAILERMKNLNAEKIDISKTAISIQVFPRGRVGIVLWEKDEEFKAECNMVFSRSIKNILLTEDIAVLGGIVASLV